MKLYSYTVEYIYSYIFMLVTYIWIYIFILFYGKRDFKSHDAYHELLYVWNTWPNVGTRVNVLDYYSNGPCSKSLCPPPCSCTSRFPIVKKLRSSQCTVRVHRKTNTEIWTKGESCVSKVQYRTNQLKPNPNLTQT